MDVKWVWDYGRTVGECSFPLFLYLAGRWWWYFDAVSRFYSCAQWASQTPKTVPTFIHIRRLRIREFTRSKLGFQSTSFLLFVCVHVLCITVQHSKVAVSHLQCIFIRLIAHFRFSKQFWWYINDLNACFRFPFRHFPFLPTFLCV